MKDFIVIGLGNFGYNVAVQLAKQSNNVLAIDSNSEKVNEIKDLVTESIIGDAKNKKLLSEFVDKSVEAVIISIGQNMESSILATHYLKEIGIKNIIVKAINEDHAQILKLMGANEIIFPEKDTALWLANRLTSPSLIEHIPLNSEFSIIEIATPDKFANKTLKELQLRSRNNLLVIGIKNILQNTYLLMPDGNFRLEPDSILLVMGKKEDLDKSKNLNTRLIEK